MKSFNIIAIIDFLRNLIIHFEKYYQQGILFIDNILY